MSTSTPFLPPRRTYHLRVFAISLALVVVALIGFLFGVQLEAIRPGTGVVQARNAHEIRATVDGLIELGGQAKLAVGEVLSPGQPVARIEADRLRFEIRKLEAQVEDLQKLGKPSQEVRAHLENLKEQLAKGRIETPKGEHWLVLKVMVQPQQAVKAGDLVVVLVPADAQTGKPKELIAELEIGEAFAGDVRVGQAVRLYSTMFAQRLHGHADGRIERIDPVGEVGAAGERKFRATATISGSPFPLHLGSSLRAEILVGRKQVYKIILEQ